jgi:KDO2-lipid IV(A) lauroyltransferase
VVFPVYLVLTFLRRLVCLLPRRLVFMLGACLGRAWYALDARERRVAKANLVNAFPEWPHRRVCRTARGVFKHLAQMALEFLAIPRYADAAYRRRWVSVAGEDHLRQASTLGRGVIILTAHIGNWELGGLLCAVLGYPAIAIADDIGSKGLMRFINETREAMGMRAVERRVVVRPILAALRAGQYVTNLVDRNAGRNGIEATFFGRVCSTPRGAAVFALKTGAPIVPGMCTVQPDGRCELRFYAPPPLEQTGDQESAVATLTQQLTSFVEARVRERPEQWHWQYKRWKPFNLGQFRRGFRYVETILVDAPGTPDDVSASLAACEHLKAAYPHSRLTVLVRAPLGDRLRDSPHVDEVIEYSHRRSLRGLVDQARMIRRLRRRYFHVAVLLSGSSRSALWAALAGIPLRVGVRGQSGGWLLTHRVAPRASDVGRGEGYVAVASRLARAP